MCARSGGTKKRFPIRSLPANWRSLYRSLPSLFLQSFDGGPRALRHLVPSVRMMVVEIVAGKESGDARCSRLLPGTMMKRSAPRLPSG